MTKTPATQESFFPDSAETIDDIGAEFGCEREPNETDNEFGERITACLDGMIEEMQLTQDRVQELV